MKLSYRGISYDQEQAPLEVQEGAIAGKYRGQDWKYHYPRHIPQSSPKLYRQYRGVTYSTSSVTSSEKNACSVPCCQNTVVIKNQISQVHLENMRRNLERRLRIAEANGDENLVNLLKKESEQLTL